MDTLWKWVGAGALVIVMYTIGTDIINRPSKNEPVQKQEQDWIFVEVKRDPMYAILMDTETGCQYIRSQLRDMMVPRLRPDGKPVCIEVKPLSEKD